MDPQGAFVWGVDLRLDYTVEPEEGGEEADDALALELQAEDLILGVQPGGIFEVRHVRTNERVTYQARRDQHTWVVDELTRLPWVEPGPDPSAPAAIEHVEVSLELLDRGPLADSERGQTALLQDARAWCIEEDGQLLVVREGSDGGFVRSRHDLESGAHEPAALP
ncbi:MAG: hypothetical protein P1V81_09585, partial [Planctomycetota bacterium]|nr:hypothetical protein [Planctomycetota bacterium]